MKAHPSIELVELTATFVMRLVREYPVSDALHDLVAEVPTLLGIAGAGISLTNGDALAFAAATDERIATLERLQEEARAGPCVEALRGRIAVAVADVRDESRRWPALADAATGVEVVAVAGIPMHPNGTPFGALDLYDSDRRAWSEDDLEVANLFAAMATAYVANAARLDEERHTTEQLQEALTSRVAIEQAKGILAGERGISVDMAFSVLRSHARRNNVSLRRVADAVVGLGLRP